MGAEANQATIERFYEAFGQCNGAAMTACYAPGAHFRDPAFGDLEGDDIGAMWRMLTGRATDLKIELHEHEANEETGRAHWIARYTFSTGRPVVNDIQATFRFAADGLDILVEDLVNGREGLGRIGHDRLGFGRRLKRRFRVSGLRRSFQGIWRRGAGGARIG